MNEWDKIKEVIVGSARQSTLAAEYYEKTEIPEDKREKLIELTNTASPQWFLDEVNEDLDNLASILKKFGAKVFRPTEHNINKFYSGPFWTATGNNFYNVRDLHLIIETMLLKVHHQELVDFTKPVRFTKFGMIILTLGLNG